MPKTTTMTVLLGSLGLCVLGCGAAPKANSSAEAVPGTAEVTDVSGPPTMQHLDDAFLARSANPVNHFMSGGLTSSQLEAAMDERIARCMADAGFKYVARQFEVSEPVTRGALIEFRATYGFGFWSPPEPTTDSSNDPNLALMQSLDPTALFEYLDALEGSGRRSGVEVGDGCRHAAESELAATVPLFAGSTDVAALQTFLSSSAAVAEASSAYASCMKSAGHSEAIDPDSARALASETKTLTEELALAAADVGCQSATIWPMWDTLEPELASVIAD